MKTFISTEVIFKYLKMKRPLSVLFFAYLSMYCVSAQDLDVLINPFRRIRLETFKLINATTETKLNFDLLQAAGKMQRFVRKKFPCSLDNARSPQPPTSVHKLRPGDIDVIGALGDSLTAGVGLKATNIFQVSLEHRGIAASAGGEGSWRRFLTLPNILKKFNPKLIGFATGNSLTLHKESQLNLGETAAVSEDMPYMAEMMVKRMRTYLGVNVSAHWKMITFMIGPNDFCSQICFKDNVTAILEKHREELRRVLTILKDNLSRTIVNLIPPPNLRLLTEFSGKSHSCGLHHLVECPCLFGPTSNNRQKLYFELMDRWQEIDMEVGNSAEFDSDDFTVVVQPFTLQFFIPNTETGQTDYTYLSQDCFHMSQKGNARIANSLWNNIMEPEGSKSKKPVKLFSRIKCPTKQHPFIYTRRNSQQ